MKVMTEARREAIVDAATKLFQEVGYERASMSELASRLGGSKATLYRYYPSKEALFVAVVKASATSHLSKALEELQVEGIEGKTQLRSALTRFGERLLLGLTGNESGDAVYRMVIGEAGRSDVGQLFYESGPAECISGLSALLEAAMERGVLRRADPRITALQFTGLVTAETGLRLYQRNPPPLKPARIREMVERAVDMFFAGAAQR